MDYDSPRGVFLLEGCVFNIEVLKLGWDLEGRSSLTLRTPEGLSVKHEILLQSL